MEEAQARKIEPESQEHYFMIKIAPARDKMDLPHAVVTVGNKAHKNPRLMIKRQQWVPVTSGYVYVLKQTTYPVYQNVEGEDRKVISYRTRFPLEGEVEITKEGYQVLRQKSLAGEELKEADFAQYRV